MAQLFLPSQMQKVHCGYCGVHVKRSHLRNEHIPIFHPGQDYLEAQGVKNSACELVYVAIVILSRKLYNLTHTRV